MSTSGPWTNTLGPVRAYGIPLSRASTQTAHVQCGRGVVTAPPEPSTSNLTRSAERVRASTGKALERAPVVATGHEDLDERRAVWARDDVVRSLGPDRSRLPRPQLALLAVDPEGQRPSQQHADLLVLVRMLRYDR